MRQPYHATVPGRGYALTMGSKVTLWPSRTATTLLPLCDTLRKGLSGRFQRKIQSQKRIKHQRQQHVPSPGEACRRGEILSPPESTPADSQRAKKPCTLTVNKHVRRDALLREQPGSTAVPPAVSRRDAPDHQRVAHGEHAVRRVPVPPELTRLVHLRA